MKINFENTSIIAKLSKNDMFSFLQRRQSVVKGRTFVYIERIGKICYYSEINSTKILETNWNRDIIKKSENEKNKG
jgi:hypothetical protein